VLERLSKDWIVFVFLVMKKRKPNVAQTLLKNSISALFCAIEIHNKPKIEYRYPNVVVILLNAWELVLKAYIYKILKNKKITELNNERYPTLDKCINLAFVWDKNLIYKSSIEKLSEYRNKIIHAFTSDLDEVMYSVIFQNIILFWRFTRDFLQEDLANYDETLILLPIGFKKPFSPIEFLSNESHLQDGSKDVKNFIEGLIKTTESLYSKWIDETIFISYDIELLWKNNFKNADLLLWIDQKSPYKIQKETKLRLSHDKSIQAIRNLTIDEIKENFEIPSYRDIPILCRERYNNFPSWNKKALKIYRDEIKPLEKKWIYWEIDFTDNNKILFSRSIFEEIFDKYYSAKTSSEMKF
jgi:hypothetical protein